MLSGRPGARAGFGSAAGGGYDRDGDGGWWSEQSGWAKAGSVCAALFVALLTICGAIIGVGALAAPHRSPVDQAEPASMPKASASFATASPIGAGNATPTAGSPSVSWQRVGIGALPFSSTAGPRTTRGGVPSGFSHDGSGAVLAAAQILGRLSWAAESTASMEAVADADTLPSAQARASLTYAPPTDASLVPAVVAFQLVSSTSDAASVDLALRFSGTLRVVPASLLWVGGDWKLAGAPGPLAQSSWASLDDLTGFTAFTGQPATGS